MLMQNLHTHTIYCDGKDTPEEIIETAISKGFSSIGFSGHSYMWASNYFQEYGDKTPEYKKEVLSLKEKYKGIIDIFLGLEVEMYAKVDLKGYDYLIGSVHYLDFKEECVSFDLGIDSIKYIIDKHFSGDGMAFAKEYYRCLSHLPEYGKFDIIGHFDLITKYQDTEKFFDIEEKEYKNAYMEAIDALCGKIPYFEVNTGAISRGYRKSPYPSMDILKELKNRGFGAVITSDCHDRRFLDTGFSMARDMLKEAGYKSQFILTNDGFTESGL